MPCGGDTDWLLNCKINIAGCQGVTKGFGVRRPYLSTLCVTLAAWKKNKEKL